MIDVADIAEALASVWGLNEREQPEQVDDMLDQLGVDQPARLAADLHRCSNSLFEQQPAIRSATSVEAAAFGLRCGFAIGVGAERTRSGNSADEVPSGCSGKFLAG